MTRFAKAKLALAIGVGALTTACLPGNVANTDPPNFPSDAGRLFCNIQLAGGGALAVALIDASATAAAPGASPFAIIATNQTKAFVDEACRRAAQQVAGAVAGAPVSPPAGEVRQVQVTPPPDQRTAPIPVASLALGT